MKGPEKLSNIFKAVKKYDFKDRWKRVEKTSGFFLPELKHLSPDKIIETLHNVPVVEEEQANNRSEDYYYRMQCATTSLLLKLGFDFKTHNLEPKITKSFKDSMDFIYETRLANELSCTTKDLVNAIVGEGKEKAESAIHYSIPEKVNELIPDELLSAKHRATRDALAEYLIAWNEAFKQKEEFIKSIR